MLSFSTLAYNWCWSILLYMSNFRAEYTTPEWQTLQTAIIGTGFYIHKLSPNFLEAWRTKRAANDVIDDAEDDHTDEFFRELCDTDDFKSKIPKHLPRDAAVIEVPVLQAISHSLHILAAKDASKVEPFKQLIREIAYSAADEANEVSASERAAITKIEAALDGSYDFGDLTELTNPFV